MKLHRFITTLLCFMLSGQLISRAQDIDTQLSDMADKLSAQIQDQGKKKVAVIDFTDLDGSPCGSLGKYIAEQLNVDLVMGKRTFSVLDRANLKSILDEHKLTAKGLVDPDNAKKLGEFAGVDALILGTITPKSGNYSLTAKIVTTDTAEIVGAARTQFKGDANVQQLVAATVTEAATTDAGGGDSVDVAPDSKPKVTKSFGDLSASLDSLQVINGGRQYLLTMTLSNHNKKKSIWVAFNGNGMSVNTHGTIRDENGYEFGMSGNGAEGIVTATPITTISVFANSGPPVPDRMNQATEIAPGDSVTATAKFVSEQNRPATAGKCNVQIEFLVSKNFSGGVPASAPGQSLTGRVAGFGRAGLHLRVTIPPAARGLDNQCAGRFHNRRRRTRSRPCG